MNKATLSSVAFVPILEQPADVAEAIRRMRNAPEVRAWMYSDHEISPGEHAAWLAGLRGNDAQHVFTVMFEGGLAGLVSVNGLDRRHRTASWAFYLDPALQGKGVGGIVEFKLLDLAFGQLGLEKLNCEVLALNEKVVAMHQKFGFHIEGVRRANVVKHGERVDVVLLGMLATEWEQQRPRFARLFGADPT